MGQRRREILCIDDDMRSLQVRRILLETYGFDVLTAIGGREGLRAFRQHGVDAVVMDYHMPDIDGGMVAKLIKSQRPDVPVLILSALPWLPEDAPQECIDAFLCKGEPTARLVRTIEMLVEQHARSRTTPIVRRAAAVFGRSAGLVARAVQGIFGNQHKPARRAFQAAAGTCSANSDCSADECTSGAVL